MINSIQISREKKTSFYTAWVLHELEFFEIHFETPCILRGFFEFEPFSCR